MAEQLVKCLCGFAMRHLTYVIRIVAHGLFLANIYAAYGQSALPRLTPGIAHELFSTYASCEAYWKIIRACLPPELAQRDQASIQKSFDRLQEDGFEQMKWLGEKAQLSAGMQQRITDRANVNLKTAIGNNCANGSALIREYRDKCAALFQNVGEAQYPTSPANQPTAAEIAESTADFTISTCYEPIDDISLGISYGRIMGWKALSAVL